MMEENIQEVSLGEDNYRSYDECEESDYLYSITFGSVGIFSMTVYINFIKRD